MLVKVSFNHTLIATEPNYMVVEATVSKHELVPVIEIKSLDFKGHPDGWAGNRGKSLYLSVSGPAIVKILDIITEKVKAGEYTEV
jgi:hypothetical protein